ncbi:hypothetical protein [Kineosporia succinea]|uniref:Fucose permease n=1 Tax=Kineosporia succinea TaxID=84632 RepID=A0ABT9P1A5_9ACTN|nr:hypothetical protein [Kineosporia succinea]MDP9826199.1 fucose permease [Kineosporia succinea]
MTKAQRFQLIAWSVFGFLGLVRAVYAVTTGYEFGILLGVLWCAFGAYKAWQIAKLIDEQALAGGPQRKQPDRPRKSR